MLELTHEYYMQLALKQAQIAYEAGEIPVGAVILSPKGIVAQAHNQTERLQDVTAHAEMLAITAAAQHLGAKYLRQCTLYVTLEPCVMCAGACYWAQLGAVIYGAADEKRGFGSQALGLHPKTKIIAGVLEEDCKALLQAFFKRLR
jgi:tRNA(adenine34) deaminase